MDRLSDRFLQLGVVFALIGMGLGVWMGAAGAEILAPVHAHINLLGWASMMLYGLFYRVIPGASRGVLPVVHFWLALAGLVLMIPTLWLLLLGHTAVGPLLGVVSILLWIGMAVFAVIVFRATGKPVAA